MVGESMAEKPTHVFAAPGYYTVTLAVTGTNGCYSETSQQVRVSTPFYLPTVFRDW